MNGKARVEYIPISKTWLDQLTASANNWVADAKRINSGYCTNTAITTSVLFECALVCYLNTRIARRRDLQVDLLWWDPISSIELDEPELKQLKVSSEVWSIIDNISARLARRGFSFISNYPGGRMRCFADAIVYNFIRWNSNLPSYLANDINVLWTCPIKDDRSRGRGEVPIEMIPGKLVGDVDIHDFIKRYNVWEEDGDIPFIKIGYCNEALQELLNGGY